MWIIFSLAVVVNFQFQFKPSSASIHKKITTYLLFSLLGDFAYVVFNFGLLTYFISERKCLKTTDHTLSSVLFIVATCTLLLEFLAVSIFLKYCATESEDLVEMDTGYNDNSITVDTDTMTRFDIINYIFVHSYLLIRG